MSTFFRGITEPISSLFRGIFSEPNSVEKPYSREEDSQDQKKAKMVILIFLLLKFSTYPVTYLLHCGEGLS
jgi:hypothetical protein